MIAKKATWLGLGLGIVVVSGCSIWKPKPEWPWIDKPPCSDICENKHAIKAFTDAMTYCIALQDYHSRNGGALNSGRFVMAATGTLAGAVFAPLASGSASTAWSGLSGSTNALQSALDENFSTVMAVKRRASVAQAGKDGMKSFPSESEANSKVYASVSMAFNCATAAAEVESAAIREILGVEVANPSVKK